MNPLAVHTCFKVQGIHKRHSVAGRNCKAGGRKPRISKAHSYYLTENAENKKDSEVHSRFLPIHPYNHPPQKNKRLTTKLNGFFKKCEIYLLFK